ncbi:MAG: MBL fold metallo-hydrolase [Paracoccaceae bacterium]
MEFYAETTQPLTEHIALLAQKGSPSGGTGRPLNGWLLRLDNEAIAFDAGLPAHLDALDGLDVPLKAIVLSHADVAAQAEAVHDLAEAHGCAVFLHEADIADRRLDGRRERFSPVQGLPVAVASFDRLRLELVEIPGHSPGSVMLYDPREGGALLTGDSAVTPGPEQDAEPERIEYPRMDDEAFAVFAARWRALLGTTRIAHVLPLHGRAYTYRDDATALLGAMLERAPMRPGG